MQQYCYTITIGISNNKVLLKHGSETHDSCTEPLWENAKPHEHWLRWNSFIFCCHISFAGWWHKSYLTLAVWPYIPPGSLLKSHCACCWLKCVYWESVCVSSDSWGPATPLNAGIKLVSPYCTALVVWKCIMWITGCWQTRAMHCCLSLSQYVLYPCSSKLI